MKSLSFLLLLIPLLFAGCGTGDSTKSENEVSRTNAPQPDVADESLRPPKPPSI